MTSVPWFEIKSEYGPTGIRVTLDKIPLLLSNDDICYLLVGQNGPGASQGVDLISFVLQGHPFCVTESDWMVFEDALSAHVGSKGWNHTLCS